MARIQSAQGKFVTRDQRSNWQSKL